MVPRPQLYKLTKDDIAELSFTNTLSRSVETFERLNIQQKIQYLELELNRSDDVVTTQSLASLYLTTDNLDSAYTLFEKLTDIEPSASFAYFNKAKIFYKWKSYPDALAEVEESLRLEPENEETIVLKSEIIQKMHYSMNSYYG